MIVARRSVRGRSVAERMKTFLIVDHALLRNYWSANLELRGSRSTDVSSVRPTGRTLAHGRDVRATSQIKVGRPLEREWISETQQFSETHSLSSAVGFWWLFSVLWNRSLPDTGRRRHQCIRVCPATAWRCDIGANSTNASQTSTSGLRKLSQRRKAAKTR